MRKRVHPVPEYQATDRGLEFDLAYATYLHPAKEGMQMIWIEGYDSVIFTEINPDLLADFQNNLEAQVAKIQRLRDIIQTYGLDSVNIATSLIASSNPSELEELRSNALVDALLKWEGK